MKIKTILRHRGLTLPQYAALRSARRGPLHRVAATWRERGSRDAIRTPAIEAIAAKGLLEIQERTAVLTDAGARMLRELEGRR